MSTDIRKYFVAADRGLEEDPIIMKNPKKSSSGNIYNKKSDHVNPVIVTFQNGELNDGSDFNVSLTNNNGRTNVSIETSYGHVFKEAKIFNSTQKQTILVRNRKTNKVKLVEVDNAFLINSALLSTTETLESEENFAKKFKTLQKTFGGKRIVNRLEQREKLNISSLPVADEVKQTIQEIEVEDNISLNETESESIMHLLPPCHRDANLVSEVYKIEEILSEEELEALQQEVIAVANTKFDPQLYSQFSMACYEEAIKSKEDLHTRIAGILFIESLIKFLKIPSKKLTSKNVVLCPFSSVIHDRLLKDFCVKTENSVTRPLTMRDKCLCYIMALSLICCNYKINLKLLSISAAEHLKKLSRLARAVGAVPLAKQENFFVLKLPLPQLPKVTAARTRKK